MKVCGFALLAGALLLIPSGCGDSECNVSGRVTCDGKPISGSILFSPFGEGADNTGPGVGAPLNEDGTYTMVLKSKGKHRVVVSPKDVVYPAEPGKEHRCDLAPQERELTVGKNIIDIDLPKRAQ